MIRVLLVDDQALVRAGFRALLEAAPDVEVIGEAGTGVEALDHVRELNPHVVLMDVRMPEMDGIEATRRLGAEPSPPAVVMLTTFDLDEYVYDALKAGAIGFLLKDARAEQLVTAVRAARDGDRMLAPAVTRRLIEQYVNRPRTGAGPPHALNALSQRELEILRHLARGLSNAELADALYLSEATIKTHVGRVLTKLGVRDRVQAVIVAYETGLIEPGST